jgi:hypothetical protein
LIKEIINYNVTLLEKLLLTSNNKVGRLSSGLSDYEEKFTSNEPDQTPILAANRSSILVARTTPA